MKKSSVFMMLVSLLITLAFILQPLQLATATPSNEEEASGFANTDGPDDVKGAAAFDESKPLTVLAEAYVPTGAAAENREQFNLEPEWLLNIEQRDGLADAAVQNDSAVRLAMPPTLANFEGVNNIDGVHPPDTVGDIGYDPDTGTSYYFQWVNLHFQAWDVTNPASPAAMFPSAVSGNALWAGFGGPCENYNDGDPIVLFDQFANRWMVSQFAVSSSPYYQCIAVSSSADPSGSWYRYAYEISDINMNDYPKLGVWPVEGNNAYFMTVNQFANAATWAGTGVFAFERANMLKGQYARMVYFNLNDVEPNLYSLLPADLDGLILPPANTPGYFAMASDSTDLGVGDATDMMRIWEFDVNWNNPATSTFGNAAADPVTHANQKLAVANFSYMPCATRSCIPQPGTTSGLDALSYRLMHRLAFRMLDATKMVMVANQTVDGGSGRAGVRWYQMERTSGTWAMANQSTYAPADTTHRWMASAAMDRMGNLAVGYSGSSATLYPSIYYAGRLYNDPANTLAQGEGTIIVGSGSQTSTYYRWGDYSSMNIDPKDDCTFWFTQEYYETTSSSGWQTRIASFTFPSCTAQETGYLEGTVTDGINPVANAVITVQGFSTMTNASGYYKLLLLAGNYTATASAFGYSNQSASGITVTANATSTQNFVLTALAHATINGIVEEATPGGHNWPLYATINIEGYPYGAIYTDPITGAYSVNLPEGESYEFTVEAVLAGYTDANRTVAVPVGGGTENFQLSASLTSCSAPGYALSSVVTEGFEGAFPPTGWTRYQQGNTSVNWARGAANQTGSYLKPDPHGGTYYAWHDYYASATVNNWLVTSRLTLPTGTPILTFWENEYWAGDADLHEVAITTSATGNPATATYTTLYNTIPAEDVWSQVTLDLSAYAGQQVYIAFHYRGLNGDEWYIDDVAIGSCSVVPGGLMVGQTYDANAPQPAISGVNVTSESQPAETTVSYATPADAATPDGLYFLFSTLTGEQNITASKYRYDDQTDAVTIASEAITEHDFYLNAGKLTATPDTVEITLAPNSTGAQTITLDNVGTLGLTFMTTEVNTKWEPMNATGMTAPNLRRLSPKHIHDLNGQALYTPQTANAPYPNMAAGDVISSFATGLTYSWGLGLDTSTNTLWVGNNAAGGGDDLNHEYSLAGTQTGNTIDTAEWVGIYAADMAYNPFTGMMWQVNVGGDNCVYEMDPVAQISTGRKICPEFGTSERGLAFDPLTNTFFAGSWNDASIRRFTTDGVIVEEANVGLDIAGLAYNPMTGHLFVSTNSLAGFDVYVLDVNNAYANLGGFDIGGTYTALSSGGLDMDAAGNLWIVDNTAMRVFRVDSGETGIDAWEGMNWADVSPVSGSIASSGQATLTVTFDSTGFTAGNTYEGFIYIASDTPYGDIIIPVVLHVSEQQVFLPVILQ